MFRRRALWATLAVAFLLAAAVGAFAVQAWSGGAREIVLTGTESGLLPLLPIADAAAASWHDDALLMTAAATEGKPIDGRVDPPFLYDTSPDPLVGNAMAVAWTFAYVSPSEPGKILFVTVGGDQSIVYQRALVDPSYGCCVTVSHSTHGSVSASPSHDEEPSPPEALVRPTLDSHDAFAKVAERPEFASFAADHPVFQAFLVLDRGYDRNPVWNIGYRTATYFSAHASVDAATGEVLSVNAWPSPPSPPVVCEGDCGEPQPPEPHPCCPAPEDYSETFRTTLGPSRPMTTYNVIVEGYQYAEQMRVAIQPTHEIAALPTDEMTLQVLDGSGRPVATRTFTGAHEAVIEEFGGPGMYQVMIHMGVPLRDVVVDVAIEVDYAKTPLPRPTEHAYEGLAYPHGGQTWVNLWYPDQRATTLLLEWTAATPADGLELALHDSLGNEIATVRATFMAPGEQALSLDVPTDDERCCLTAVVRNLNPAFTAQAFRLTVMVEDWQAVHYGGYVYH